MYGLSGLAKNLNFKNWLNSTQNCVHYMYGWYGFAKKLNIQNSVNSTTNCVNKCTNGFDMNFTNNCDETR